MFVAIGGTIKLISPTVSNLPVKISASRGSVQRNLNRKIVLFLVGVAPDYLNSLPFELAAIRILWDYC